MIINKNVTYSFDKGTSVNFIQESCKHIIVVMDDSKNSGGNALRLFDKGLKPLKTIPFKDVVIERILIDADGTMVAVVCPEQAIMIIINVETGDQREFVIPGAPDDNNEQGLYPSALYYWQGDQLIIYTVYEKIYRINIQTGVIASLALQDIQKQHPLFYDYLQEAKKYAPTHIINAMPHEYQFSFHDVPKQEIGFFDLRKGIKYTVAYVSDDIHEVYFYLNHLIVVSCHVIQTVDTQGVKSAYIQPDDRDEMRGSVFISSQGNIIMLDRYWRKVDYQMNLYLFHIET